MARIFISYARADGSEIANLLEQRLVLRKHDVFLDTVDIPGGADWEKVIARKIRQCRLMIVVVTAAVHHSKYVYQEFDQAREHRKLIVPIRVNEAELPFYLQKFNALDLSYTDPQHNTLGATLGKVRTRFRLTTGQLGLILLILLMALIIVGLAWLLQRQHSLPAQGNLLNVIINGADPALCMGGSDRDVAAKSWAVADTLTAASCVQNLLKWEPKAVDQQLARLQDGTCKTQPSSQDMQLYFRDNWALSSLATGYYNLGIRFEVEGDNRLAREAFQRLLSNYSCAWVWDQGEGVFWSIAPSARAELDRLSQACAAPVLTPTP
jgi:hypothetical protein